MDMLLGSRSALALKDIPVALAVLIGALVLVVPMGINGGPIVYFDTAAYIEQIAKGVAAIWPSQPSAGVLASAGIDGLATTSQPADGALMAFGVAEGDDVLLTGRSAYYGALAYVGWQTSIWLPALIQSAALSWLVVCLFRRMAGDAWAVASLVTLVLLTALTPAAFFAGLIMPDIWAGLMILALALLWCPGVDLSARSRSAIFAIIAFAALAHQSNLALLCVLCAGFGVIYFSSRMRPARWTLTLPLLALGCGVLGSVAFSFGVREIYGVSPVARPHITAQLVDMGPGADFARDSCPESGFVLCDYADRLPVNWISFLFDQDPETGVFGAASPEVQKALSDEQLRFAIGTLAARPFETVTGLLGDGAAQLWTLSITDVPLTRENQEFLETRFPPNLVQMTQETVLYHQPEMVTHLTRLTQVTSALSAILLLGWGCLRVSGAPPKTGSDPAADQALWAIIAVCVAGLIANALICGILASPYGRFQARVVWILPLLVCLFTTQRYTAKARREVGLPIPSSQ